MSVPDIAVKPLPGVELVVPYEITSGDARYKSDGSPDGCANNVRWDASLFFTFYDNNPTGPAYPTTATNLTVLGVGQGGTTADVQFAFGYVDASELVPANQFESSVWYRLSNGVSGSTGRAQMTRTIHLSECLTGVDTISSSATGTGAYSGVDFALPTLTPAVEGSMALYVMFIDEDIATLDASNFDVTPDFLDIGTYLSGSTGTVVIAGFSNRPASAFTPTFTVEGTAVHWTCIAHVIAPKTLVMDVPRLVPGSFVQTANNFSVTGTAAEIPTSADCDVQYGDILCTTITLQGSATTSFANTAGWDLVQTNGPTIALRRILSAADLDAVASDPPLSGVAGSGTIQSFLIRGIQRSGSYIYSNAVNSPSSGTFHNFPVTAGAVTDMLVTVMNVPNQKYRVQINALDGIGRAVHAWWKEQGSNTAAISLQPAGATGAFNQRWTKISSGGIYYGSEATLISSAPTHWVDGEASAAATVSTVITAESGAQFIQSSVEANAVVSTAMTARRPRQPRPRRQYVWLNGIDGQPTGVLA